LGAWPVDLQWPGLLWAFGLVPLAVVAYLLSQRRRVRQAAQLANPDLLPNVVSRRPGWRRHLPALLYLLALSALILALARPQAIVLVPKEQAIVMLVMDVSGSMNATDVTPTRLVAAQRAASSFVDQLPAKFRVGLVTFASTAQTLVRPTTDQVAVQDALASLQAEAGTAMGDAIQRALEVKRPPPPPTTRPGRPASAPSPSRPPPVDADTPMVILLLSDGASTTGRARPLDAAADAKRLGVAIYAIALGTDTGVVALGTDTGVVDAPDQSGQTRRIPVPPDRTTLQQLAQQTGGRSYDAPSSRDLNSVYDDLGSKIAFVKQPQEITVAFTATAVLLLAAGGMLSLLWFNRFL
jgi:Ca-activated chloride channel homolog